MMFPGLPIMEAWLISSVNSKRCINKASAYTCIAIRREDHHRRNWRSIVFRLIIIHVKRT